MNIRIGFWLLCLISLVACKGKKSGEPDTLFGGVIRVAVDETEVYKRQDVGCWIYSLFMDEMFHDFLFICSNNRN